MFDVCRVKVRGYAVMQVNINVICLHISHTMQKQEKELIETPMSEAEIERLKRDIYRPDMEKFRLFTEMLRRNAALKRAVIKHK